MADSALPSIPKGPSVPRTVTVWSIARTAIVVLLGVIELSWLTPWAYILAIVISSSTKIGDVKGLAHGATEPLLPIGLIAFGLGMAWTVRTIVRRQQLRLASVYEQPVSRRLAVVVTVAAILSGALISLNYLAVPPGAPVSTTWVGTLAGGHETGALLIAVVFAAVIWWRGTILGGAVPGDREAGRRSTTAAVLIAISSGVARAVLPWLITDLLPVVAIIAVPAMLGAIALSSLEEAQLPRPGQPTATRAPDRNWIGMVAAMCLGVVVVGIILATVFGGGTSVVTTLLKTVGQAVAVVIVFALSFVAIPFLMLAEWLARMLGSVKMERPPVEMGKLGRPDPMDQIEQQADPQLLDPSLMETGLAVVALVIVAVIVWRLLRPTRVDDLDGALDEERSTVFSWRSLFNRRAGAPLEGGVAPVSDPVRLAYRKFQGLMAQHGTGRTANETARAFRDRLQGRALDVSIADTEAPSPLPQPVNDAIQTLTSTYEHVRYLSSDARARVVADEAIRVIQAGLAMKPKPRT